MRCLVYSWRWFNVNYNSLPILLTIKRFDGNAVLGKRGAGSPRGKRSSKQCCRTFYAYSSAYCVCCIVGCKDCASLLQLLASGYFVQQRKCPNFEWRIILIANGEPGATVEVLESPRDRGRHVPVLVAGFRLYFTSGAIIMTFKLHASRLHRDEHNLS